MLLLTPLMIGLSAAFVVHSEAQEASGTVQFVVTDVRNEKGSVRVLLWDAPRGYPSKFNRAKRQGTGKIVKGRAVVIFKGLPPGSWAALAYHDEDGNGQLRKNFIGMPKEGMGASRNARGRMGPPSFEDASFEQRSVNQIQRIALRYL